MSATDDLKKEYLERVERYKDIEKDNSRYPAGSSMRWWCRHCGAVSDSRPEIYNPRDYPSPKSVCDECQKMIDVGIDFED